MSGAPTPRSSDYRATLVRELSYQHWSDEQRYALEKALKWYDEEVVEDASGPYVILDEAVVAVFDAMEQSKDRPLQDRVAFLGQIIRLSAATAAGMARSEERRVQITVAREALRQAREVVMGSAFQHYASMGTAEAAIDGINAIDPAAIVEAVRKGVGQ